MSVVAALSADLSSLISESRRRNSEIKHATEYSLSLLRKFDPSRQSEADFFKQLSQEPNFITPLILSCQSRNAKFSTIAIHCLHRLISSKGLPFGSLENILDSLIEASHLPLEIQLKVLQLLPTIYQVYGDSMNDQYISKLLFICAALQGVNKPQVVVNTAAATLQQLIIFIFDKVNEEQKIKDSTVEKSHIVEIDGKEQSMVSDNVYDCYRIFNDLCSLIEHHKPRFLQFNYLSETFLLDLIESILTNFPSVFIEQKELSYLLRYRLTPIFLRSLSSPTKEFSVVVRVARIVQLLVRKNLSIMKIECEIIISLLNHIMLPDFDSPAWKKIIVLEVFNDIFKDFKTVQNIFKAYDSNPRCKHVLNDFFVNAFCLINSNSSKSLMDYRTVLHPPISSNYKALPNVPTGSSGIANSLAFEFVVDSSPDRIPYIEMLDKTDPPEASPSYIYYLILTCFNSFVEGVGKLVMDLSRSSVEDSTKKQFKFLTKLDTSDPETKSEVVMVQGMINKNYKVLISAFEVFIYSKLSNECFHNLTRSLQKLCYSSGILGLNQPRDDIIMMFAVATINNNEEGLSTVSNNAKTNSARSSIDRQPETKHDDSNNSDHRNKDKSFGESLLSSLSSRFSTHANNINQNISSLATTISNATSNPASPFLGNQNSTNPQLVLHSRYINSRHLITLRALINLGISLGSSLNDNWKCIFITLQWVNYYINGPTDNFDKKFTYAKNKYGIMPEIKQNEIQVIQSSIRKLLESSKEYSLPVIITVLRSLIELSDSSIKIEKSKDLEKHLFERITTTVFMEGSGTIADNEKTESAKEVPSLTLSPCYYHKYYFLELIGTFSRLSSSRFLSECIADTSDFSVIEESESPTSSLKVVFKYMIDISTNRSLSSIFRIKSATIFNTILQDISKEFSENDETKIEIGSIVEVKLLNSLLRLIGEMKNLQLEDNEKFLTSGSQSLINIVGASVVNCDFDIIFKCYENLKDLLDMFGVSFKKDCWVLVFRIIALSFELFEYGDKSQDFLKFSEMNSSYGLIEKKSEITKLSFEVVQLILNDFLTMLPLSIIKTSIDSIYKFTYQTFDINISFSAISYFLQISDYIKEMIKNNASEEDYEKGDAILMGAIKSKEDLVTFVDSKFKEDYSEADAVEMYTIFSSLWIYLLKVLVDISGNPKDQVRNGAIQTFFRVLDTHGKHIISWDLCYNIVISSLFQIRPKILKTVGWEQLSIIKREWSETLILIMNGIVRFYCNYLCDFKNLELEKAVAYWSGLISYFEDVLKLQWNNCDLKLNEAYNELLKPFIGEHKVYIPKEIVELLFNFWANRTVSYNVTLSKHYQDSLTALMKSYTPLLEILGSDMDSEKIKKSLLLFNSAIKYPVLPTYFNDDVYPTYLQKSVLENLSLMVETDSAQSDIILQLIANVVLPFSTRSKIKEQMVIKNRLPKDTKICSFVSLSYYSVIILKDQIARVRDFKPLLQNQCVMMLAASLLEPIKQNAKGILVSNKKKSIAAESLSIDLINTKELWIECVEIILYVYEKVVTLIAEDDASNQIPFEMKQRLWQLVVELYKTTLNISDNGHEYEAFNVGTLDRLKNIIVPYISLKCFPRELLNTFTRLIMESSYVYEKDEIEDSLIDSEDHWRTIDNLVKFDFENDIPLAKPLVIVQRYKISLICLNDLIEFSKISSRDSLEEVENLEDGDLHKSKVKSQEMISTEMFPCFLARAAYVMRKFISSRSIASQIPLSKIQKLEIIITLKGLNDLLESFKNSRFDIGQQKYKQVSIILPLMVKTIPICSKIRGIDKLIEIFFDELNDNLAR